MASRQEMQRLIKKIKVMHVERSRLSNRAFCASFEARMAIEVKDFEELQRVCEEQQEIMGGLDEMIDDITSALRTLGS